jgi:hypothetical protein
MSDSKKDRRDVKDRTKDRGKGWTREKSRFEDDEEFDSQRYIGNVKDIPLDEDDEDDEDI